MDFEMFRLKDYSIWIKKLSDPLQPSLDKL